MQDVSFLIKRTDRKAWQPMISVIEKAGYEVLVDPVPSEVTVVLSGCFVNPFAIQGKKILLTHSKEWGSLWESIHKVVLKEYYDSIISIEKIPPNLLMGVIRGEIEAAKPGSKD